MQSAPRVDLYGTVHKALRARLFDLGVELDRCDFGKPLEVTVALGAYRRTMGFIREHHEHEDNFIAPALARCGQPIVDAVAQQHAQADAILAELDALVATIDGGTADRRALGNQLCTTYRRFLIQYLEHMQHEEIAINAALWERFTDAELTELRARLQSSIPPARFGEWLEIILPALNFDERTGMLRGIKAGAPAPAFAAASQIAARVLGAAGWNAVKQQLESSNHSDAV